MKHLEEQAQSFEDAGLHQDALEAYSEVYRRDARRSEARIAMQRNAQLQLDKQLNEVDFLYLKKDHLGAVRAFEEAEEMKTDLESFDLELLIPAQYAGIYSSARQAHSSQLFETAKQHVKDRRFEEAEDILYDLTRVDPVHMEANYLWKIAELEPKYLQAQKAEELGYYRDAYRLYKKVTNKDIQYKDALDRQQLMAEKASYTVAYVPIGNSVFDELFEMLGRSNRAEDAFASSVKDAILDLDDPLIRLVDRENTDHLLAEQRRAMSDVYRGELIEAGELLGAQYVLTGKILKFNKVSKKCDYMIEMMETSTGEIHFSEIITFDRDDFNSRSERDVEDQITDHVGQEVAAYLAAFDPFAK